MERKIIMGIKTFLARMFTKSPQTLGEGLARVKKHFGVVGENLSIKPGERLYNTISGNKVSIADYGSSLHIDKVLSPVTRGDYKSYIGTPASITKNYFNNVRPGDNKVALSRSIIRETFAPIGGNAQNSYENVYRNGVKRHFNMNVDDMCLAVIPRVKTNFQYNCKKIPYQKAISMGLKI